MPDTAKDQIRAKSQGGGMESLVLPKLPYMPPPSDPRQMPSWYDRWYRGMEDWREKVNQSLVATVATTATP